MKRLLLWLLLCCAGLGLRGQTPDAEFLRIYRAIQEGESFEQRGQIAPALERYQGARRELEQFSRNHPSWNEKIVRFRLGFLAEKVGAMRVQLPPAPVPQTAPPTAETASSGASSPHASAAAAASVPWLATVETIRSQLKAAESRADEALRRADEATARANRSDDRAARFALDLRQARDRVDVLEASQRNLETVRSQLESEKATLQAKLQEALSPRPAALDPAELARAEERSRLLMKENAILRAALDQQLTQQSEVIEAAKASAGLERQLAQLREELAVERRRNESLRQEVEAESASAAPPPPAPPTTAPAEVIPPSLLASLAAKDQEIATLRAEIDSLRLQLADARSAVQRSSGEAALVSALREEVAQQQLMTDELREENARLLRELRLVSPIRITPASLRVSEVPEEEFPGSDPARRRRWERERETLRNQLEEAWAELRQKGSSPASAQARELSRQVASLEARIQVLESRPEPYTPAELALFQAPQRRESPLRPMQLAQAATQESATPAASPAGSSESASTNPPPAQAGSTPAAPAQTSGSTGPTASPAAPPTGGKGRRRTINDLPAGAGVLAAQAQRAFSLNRLDDAERLYQEILRLDESNVFTLGNLAAILVEQGRLDDGEAYLKRALAIDADDPFSLSLLGIIRFRQKRYDDAFEALSRSVQLDPENAETQNYLGITLSQRGQRKAAEAALRKALKINPGLGIAHYNLAVVYATQKPPFLELARYHYEKARRAGQPANPAFEALLEGRQATEN